MTNSALFDAISMYGRIEWGRGGGSPDRPPFLAWRFVSDDEQSGGQVSRVVAEFDGRLRWIVYQHGRNWVLQPQVVIEFEKSRDFKTDVDAATAFGVLHPDLVKAGHDDAPDLVRFLRQRAGGS